MQLSSELARTHREFGKAAFRIYLGATLVAVTMMISSLVLERKFQEEQMGERLLLLTKVRSLYLTHHLGILGSELRRITARSEFNLTDQDLDPEKSLLNLAHRQSSFFNLGMAILDRNGDPIWSEPTQFLENTEPIRSQPWFNQLRTTVGVRVLPAMEHDKRRSVLYVVAPVIHNNTFVGALMGAMDLDHAGAFDPALGSWTGVTTILSTMSGSVIYPVPLPEITRDPAWPNLFATTYGQSSVQHLSTRRGDLVVALSKVADDLVFVSAAEKEIFFAALERRLWTRIAAGLVLMVVLLSVLVILLRRSLEVFQRAEVDAVYAEKMTLVGEAANLIAHQVRNGLNNLRVGIELLCREAMVLQKHERVVAGLRQEIQHLSGFTGDLMSFSKGLSPKMVPLNLNEFVPKHTELFPAIANELGVRVKLKLPEQSVTVRADPSLLHAALNNLVDNAVQAVETAPVNGDPLVEVSLEQTEKWARLLVRDNGPGVAKEIRGSLFEPFVTAKPNGVGIGLAMARNIARAHGGDLSLVDSPERGALFCMTLPLLEGAWAQTS